MSTKSRKTAMAVANETIRTIAEASPPELVGTATEEPIVTTNNYEQQPETSPDASHAVPGARVVIYARRSKKGAPGNVTLPTQLADAEAKIASLGPVADVQTVIDDDRSARHGSKRPRWEKMLKDAYAGVYTHVIVWKLDRFSRSTSVAVREILDLEAAGVKFISCNDPIDTTTPGGVFMLTAFAGLAQLESDTTSFRVSAAHEACRKQGRVVGGRRTFGWILADVEGGGYRFSLHPGGPVAWRGTRAFDEDGPEVHTTGDTGRTEADLLREAIDDVIAGRETVTSICRNWNAMGVTTVSGKQWRNVTLSRILRSPILVGFRRHDPNWKSRTHGDYTGVDVVRDGEGKPISFAEPLVDEGTFERLQMALAANSRRSSNGRGTPLLTHVLECGRCGGQEWYGGCPRTSQRPFYSCVSCKSSTSVKANTANASLLDEFATDFIITELSSSAGRAAIASALRGAESGETAERIAVLESEMTTLEEAIEASSSARAQASLAKRMEVLESEAEALRSELYADSDRASRADSIRPLTRTEWEALSARERREIAKSVIRRIVVSPAITRGHKAAALFTARLQLDPWA